jgi:hypothetical protein
LGERRGGMRAIGAAVPRIAAPILGKEGAGAAQLLAEWPAIVGERLAAVATPLRLVFPRGQRRNGTLRLRVASAAAVEIQHSEPRILERINGFFGYGAVARLALLQGAPPVTESSTPTPPRPLGPAEEAALAAWLENVKDPELRILLERLGRAVIGSADPS